MFWIGLVIGALIGAGAVIALVWWVFPSGLYYR